MKKNIFVLLLSFLTLCFSAMSVNAADIQYMEDKEFTDQVASSENMEIINYEKTVRNKFGKFDCQYTAKTDDAKVIYELPEGSVMIGFEVIFIRPADDPGGTDSFSIKCGHNGVADDLIGTADSTIAFMMDYDNVGGRVIDVFTTDVTGEMLKENGYNTLEIDFDVVSQEKTPIGIQMVAIYYIQAEFEGVYINGDKIENNDIVSAKISDMAFDFNANVSGVEVKENDIVFLKNEEIIDADISFEEDKLLIKPQEGFKYGKKYRVSFSEALLESGIANIPQSFDFSTSLSDFVASEENINISENKCDATLKISNYTKSDKRAIACLISYKNSLVLDKNYTVIENLAAENITLVETGEINCDGAEEIVLMVWDNLLDMNPLIKEIRKEVSHE